jgi:bacterioferritin-associated ferredoxin
MGLDYDEIKEAVKEHGGDLEAIQDATEAGTICGCCAQDECDKVDLLLKDAIAKALEELS